MLWKLLLFYFTNGSFAIRGLGDCLFAGDKAPLLHGDFIIEGVYGPIFVGFVDTTTFT